jgi:opacity protein-like surface antigen
MRKIHLHSVPVAALAALRKLTRAAASILLALPIAAAAPSMSGQALPPAVLRVPLEVGASYTQARSGYTTNSLKGISVVVDKNILTHLSVESTYRRLSDTNDPLNNAYTLSETSVTTGIRYGKTFGPVTPSLSLGGGIGILSTDFNDTKGIAYAPAWTGGAALGVKVTQSISVRAEVGYQRWMPVLNFDHGLSVHLVSVGMFYRFPSRVARGAIY